MSRIPPEQIGAFRESTPDVMKLRLEELEVAQYWGVIFSEKGIKSLTKQDMTGFLSYQQNRRWKEISKEDVTANMARLKTALLCLVDETKPLAWRLNQLEPGRGDLAVPHLGKAKMTPILLVSQPKLYGVWNDYSERALRSMELFPVFQEDWRLGEQYAAVNDVLVSLAGQYRVSLWWLDVILERIARTVKSVNP
ncbi:MAG TPA: hypothetical protein VMS08_05700 [Candidatus Saccharimonadia bacterium]|nr:hypothetical protein [Candidatus Saccharimonadia bacterium]